MPPAKPTKTITVELRAITTTNGEQLNKTSRGEYNNPTMAVKPNRPMKSRQIESRKKQMIKPKAATTTTKDKHSSIAKQTRTSASQKTHNCWGNAGRQNELKIRLATFNSFFMMHSYCHLCFCRYIARKYYWLWCRRVYGRVPPSAARLHRERSLKKQSLAAWRELWWVARREWKLNIRAECHNRYTWIQYLILS